jgi:hypothetical protein
MAPQARASQLCKHVKYRFPTQRVGRRVATRPSTNRGATDSERPSDINVFKFKEAQRITKESRECCSIGLNGEVSERSNQLLKRGYTQTLMLR